MVKTYEDRLGANWDQNLELYEKEGIGILCECGMAWPCKGRGGDWQQDTDGTWYHWHGGFPGHWVEVGRNGKASNKN
jgi:hypothetical protein